MSIRRILEVRTESSTPHVDGVHLLVEGESKDDEQWVSLFDVDFGCVIDYATQLQKRVKAKEDVARQLFVLRGEDVLKNIEIKLENADIRRRWREAKVRSARTRQRERKLKKQLRLTQQKYETLRRTLAAAHRAIHHPVNVLVVSTDSETETDIEN